MTDKPPPKPPIVDDTFAHPSPETFRKQGYAMVDWLATYYEKLQELPVMSRVEPGWIRDQLPAHAPAEPDAFEAIMQDLDEVVLPGVTHWQSPHWYAYYPSNAAPISALGEMIAGGLGVQGMLWSTSPVCTELETHVLDWLVDELGLPQAFKSDGQGGGVIQDTASSSSFCAMIAARERARDRAPLHKLVVYGSEQSHSSYAKGARLAGFEHVRSIPTDADFALDVEAMRHQVAQDRLDGLCPAFVFATVGTTGSTAMDPIREIGDFCQSEDLWLHVDAAFAGSAMICPEFRHLQDGLELADSYTFNPHKWLLTNMDCNVLYVKRRRALLEAMTINPEYLRNSATESGRVLDYRDWALPLGRRFRSLKLWFVLRAYGTEQIRAMIRRHVQLAQNFAEKLAQDARFEVLAPHPLSLVCFAHVHGDQATEALLQTINARGPAFLTHTKLGGRYAIRAAIASSWTDATHVEQLWQILDESAPSTTSEKA